MGVSILDPIWCVLLGVLAVPNLIIAKRPDAKQVIDKIAPYQGWIGAVSAIWGLYRLIFTVLLHLGFWIDVMKFGVKGILISVAYILYTLVLTALGLLLGIGTLKTFIKNPQAQAKMDETLAKIQPHQGTLGIVALIDGVAMLIMHFVF